MPYDSNFPTPNTLADAVQVRAQFAGLKDLIDAGAVTSAVVDAVNTLPAGQPASVTISLVAGVLHLTFNLPQGADGGTGATGATGATGPQGPPFASAVVDGVTTLSPGQPATVTVSFDGTYVRFIFGIPRGDTGAAGNDGGTGATGPQGPPGEVTNAALDAAIAGTSSNSNAVATLDTPFTNDPPTLADLEVMRAKVNELITTLFR